MDVKVIVGLIGVFGILVAAILSSAGYLYRARVDNKKSGRKLLFLQLEIRHAILTSIMEPELATDLYLEHFSERFKNQGVDSSEDEYPNPTLKHLISNHFKNLVAAAKTNINEQFLPRLNDAIDEFSSINPVIAFKLSGKEKLEKLLEHTDNYIKSLDSSFNALGVPEHEIEIIRTTILKTREDVHSEVVGDFDSEILMLARFCGWNDFRQTRKILQNSSISKIFDFSSLDEMMDGIIMRIAQLMQEETTITK